MDFATHGKIDGYFQSRNIPTDERAVEFLGINNGPSFNQEICSPLQVTWNVMPTCKTLDINTVHQWCRNNPYNEVKAHGVRDLVTDPRLLSNIE
ncbi:MAG: delta-class carbonic anhydrase [Bdellovibrionales bacterium]